MTVDIFCFGNELNVQYIAISIWLENYVAIGFKMPHYEVSSSTTIVKTNDQNRLCRSPAAPSRSRRLRASVFSSTMRSASLSGPKSGVICSTHSL